MVRISFTWDPAKARKSLRKHGVSFDEAESVFYDDRARLVDDPDHSDSEDRFILLGVSQALRVLGCRARLPRVRCCDSHHLGSKGNAPRAHGIRRARRPIMRTEYDFSRSRQKPYAARLKRAVTIRLDEPTKRYRRCSRISNANRRVEPTAAHPRSDMAVFCQADRADQTNRV